MAEFPALPLYTDAYIGDTRHLTTEEHGAYLLLLMCAWRSPECRLQYDDDRLARMAGLSPAKWRKMKPVIMEFFRVEDGFIYQKKLKKIHADVSKKVSQNRENGKRGGRPKSLKNNEPEKANGLETENPNGTQTEPIQNQSKKEKKKRKTQLPENAPSIDDQEKALAYWRKHSTPATLQVQIDKFRANHQAKGTTFVDWGAAWRTWYTNAKDFAEREGRKGQPKGQAFEHWAQAAPQAQPQPEGPTYLDWHKAAEHFVNFQEWPAEFADKLDQCPPDIWARTVGKAA